MGSTVMMYILPMMLGQTYDLGKEKVGLQIFPDTVSQSLYSVQQYFTDSQYRMIENADQIKDFLGVSGKLSLKIKSGLLDVSGEGSYLKDSSTETKGLEILVKVHFETVTKTIPTTFKPREDWSLMDKKYLGTHYCRSITYGGDLVASIKITASNTYDLEQIKGAISGEVKAKGGSFEAEVKARLEKLKSSAQDSSSMEIKYYASVPINGVSYTIEGLLKLVEDFPNHVKNVNDGLGNPLRMELYPLSSLEGTYPVYLESRGLNELLNDIEDQFDDLRSVRKEIGIWITSLPPAIPENVQEKIYKFTDKVNNIFAIYLKTISELDTAKGASTKPLMEAIEVYKAGEYVMPQKYVRQFRSLQREIYEDAPELKPRIGGAHYIHWGRSDCDSVETETVLSGVATSSETFQNGGSVDYLCSPVDPQRHDPKTYFPNYDPEDDDFNNLLVSPVRYMGELKKFMNMANRDFACAVCRTYPRTTVLVKPGDSNCPTDNWVKEYEGILMAPGYKWSKRRYICMDKNMQAPIGELTFGNPDTNSHASVQEVKIQCGSLPCGPYAENKPIPCVVCTI